MALNIGQNFRNRINVMVAANATRAEIGAKVALTAQNRVQAMIGNGQATPKYRLYTDGVENRDPSLVKLNGGTILYRFSRLVEAVIDGLAYARANSTVESGYYQSQWFAIVNGQPWTENLTSIPFGAEVIITNFAPYSRRLEEQGRIGRVGKLKSYPKPKRVVTEQLRRYLQRTYPYMLIKRQFVLIPGGYILQTGPEAGAAMTYPAVSLSE